ncbi:MAG TPA: glycine cleavage T C-terminal barrel domain-containing protein [Candidatus Acidoferrales bacterium]|nr:glycine cleavage T C-terminal barrel domain-containing protein [Candidatus Acidoferrales bacterium]
METRTSIFESPLLAEHRAAGARIGEFSGCLLPEGFSDFDTEYKAARETVALFDTNWHLTANFTGRDRVKYLHAITSGNVKDLAADRGTLALLLNPQGRILAELEIYALPESILLRSHVSLREQTIATLRKYILGSQVKAEDATDATGSFAIEGPRTADVLKQIAAVDLAEIPDMAACEIRIDQIACRLLCRSHFAQPGAEIVASREALPQLWRTAEAAVRAHGGGPIGMIALNSLRLEAGVPWFPIDFNDTVIPHEAAVEGTHISFNKGCYTGQEIVERVRSQGRVNRKRVRLRFSSAQPPLAGTKLRANGAEVGAITSAAYSPAASTAIGMGYVRREQHAPGSRVEYEGGTAEVLA